ncbi:MAG: sensory box/GGDEF family protein [Clostridia bacterium]|nr:sensory box/GGDEF family protein [Clostridia bacterium]
MLINRIINSSLVFQHVIENMHDGVLTIDNSGFITTINPAAENILNKKKEEILGKKISEVFFEYPENDGFIQIILDAVYDASMSHHRICTYYTGEHYKSLFMTTSFLKVKIENEVQPIGVTVLFSDVTELGELRDAAVALDKIKTLNQKLEKLSYFDELTGLPNRRFFNDTCNREWYGAIQEQKQIAFIMIDIDYFKEMNDNYGHNIGDKCLSSVAGALSSALQKPNDMVACYGGDEFIVVLPDTDIEEVQIIVKRIQKNISELNIENSYSPFGRLTISIGTANYVAERGSHWENLFAGADKALYKAKQNGKNQASFL